MSRRAFFISLSVLLFAAGMVMAVRELTVPPRYNVIVLTVESTRLDAISPATTPNLWRLAKQGTRFTAHRTSSAWTAANIVSILTGLSAFRHGIHSRDASIPADWKTPLESLADAGWRVAGLQSFMLTDGFRNLGLRVTPEASLFGWLAARARRNEPFFLWRHYLDTHLPYDPPDTAGMAVPDDPETAKRMALVRNKPVIPYNLTRFQPGDRPWIARLYRGQFHAFDSWFADFWKFFERSGLRTNTILVLTTDHGEELLERGLVGHASTTRAGHLYNEITRIPLIVWLPAGVQGDNPPPAVIDRPSSHIDIMPTLFRLLGQQPPTEFEGSDLFALPPRRPWDAITSRAGFAEPDPGRIENFVAARVEGDWKLQLFLERGAVIRSELFNLARDPGERDNRIKTEPERAMRMTRALMAKVLAMRIARPGDAAAVAAAPGVPATPPQWVFPPGDGALSYDDLPPRLRLEWRGPADATYRLQYRVGEGAMAFSGEMEVAGPARDFGTISRAYWDRYIVPYRVFRLRIGYTGRDDLWSPWITVAVRQ